MRRTFASIVNDDSGASAMEYALVASLVGLVIIAGSGLFGNTLAKLFNYVGSEVSNVTPAA